MGGGTEKVERERRGTAQKTGPRAPALNAAAQEAAGRCGNGGEPTGVKALILHAVGVGGVGVADYGVVV